MADLKLREIPLNALDGKAGTARAEGNNAAWMCACGDALPLLGRSFPPKHAPNTVCPKCGRRYALQTSENKPVAVAEVKR